MPMKIRELLAQLEAAGFLKRSGKGSHRNFSKGTIRCTISGNPGDDAKPYQEREVRRSITEGNTP